MLLYIAHISRSEPLLLSWLRDHLFPCPFKYLTGLDCPGCGFQRAVLALLQGNVSHSFQIYPAAIPLILFFSYSITDRFYKLDNQQGHIKKTLFMLVGAMVLISYAVKLWHIYSYANSSALAVATI
ncbi:DUF2752 domain-containing protein [Mucilaginibacter auburnensis]|uniref:Uncharacterized protein DUF2752 n=1 Tax=Mucilaginibacter auburnensis TaxID=1457233 RepID=A0A2H9VSQ4_9SPHI|nr:DUF2752 domain-containing protein [Mucilaginibacter auburnensis]PJJ83838.1 uncharacterized protein DUF2752 [Mucilaginibacter auburnensis]